jgi:PPE-repeat protein
MDYGALPPEVNSGRIYSGPGSGSMTAAAAGWDELARELYTAAAACGEVAMCLTGAWSGPAATSMSEAAAPYILWLGTTAGRAEHAAAQAMAAAEAYEAAFAATVPPPLIAANRAQLVALIATNVLGQNSPAIAAAEIQYDEMWAQDAAAMYGYAGTSAAASTLTPFSQPPPTTDAARSARQVQEVVSSGSELISALPQALQGLAAAPASVKAGDTLTSLMSKFNAVTGPVKYVTYPMTLLNQALSASKAVAAPVVAAKAAESVADAGARAFATPHLPGPGGAAHPAFSAAVGRGVSIGPLSVPHNWVTVPSTTPAVAGTPGWTAPPFSGASSNGPVGGAPPGMPLLPLANMGERSAGGPATFRYELRSSVVPRSPAAG